MASPTTILLYASLVIDAKTDDQEDQVLRDACCGSGRARRVVRSASRTGDDGGHRSSQGQEDELRPSSGGVIGHQGRGVTPVTEQQPDIHARTTARITALPPSTTIWRTLCEQTVEFETGHVSPMKRIQYRPSSRDPLVRNGSGVTGEEPI